jgi:hypothetical protein
MSISPKTFEQLLSLQGNNIKITVRRSQLYDCTKGKPMSSIFLSHSSRDKRFARRLARDLQAHGVRVWIDEAEMLVGDSLVKKLEEAIREMEYLGVLLSPNSVNSEWVQREVEIALNQEIRGKRVKVLPILYKECEVPGFLSAKVWVDFRKPRSYSPGVDALLRRLLGPQHDGVTATAPLNRANAFRVLNWNIGGRRFFELQPNLRSKFRLELNSQLTALITKYKPDVVTLQEIVSYRAESTAATEELIEPIPGYTYHPVTLVDSITIARRGKWEEIRQLGSWSSEVSFAQGNAFLIRSDTPLFGLWDLPKLGSPPLDIEDRRLAIETVSLDSGLYFGDRDTEPRAAMVSHFVCASRGKNRRVAETDKPLDVFVVNVQLATLVGEREGLPSLEDRATATRKAQLEILFHGIVSRYNDWRHNNYPLAGQPHRTAEHETLDRHTPIWILSGAFNFTENSEEYAYVKRMNFVDAVPNKGSGTKSRGIGHPAVLTLDYIFAGPLIVAMSPVISKQALLMNIVDHSVNVSDHFPMFALIPLAPE